MDTQLFLLINNLPHPQFLVVLAKTFSAVANFGLIWIVLGLFLVYIKRFNLKVLIQIVIVLILSAYLVEGVLKQVVGRLRPEFTYPQLTVYDQTSDYLSFPSSHASTSFAAAVVLAKIFPQGKRFFYILAALISFSRVYLGVHYPFDVLVGALIGIGVGYGVVKMMHMKNSKHIVHLAIVLFIFLLIPSKVLAKTVLIVSPQGVTVSEEKQVLGITTGGVTTEDRELKQNLNIKGGTLQVRAIGDLLHISKDSGSQEVDEVRVSGVNLFSKNGKIVIKEKLAQASTKLPLIIEQATGKIIADTGVDKKVLNLFPMDVFASLKAKSPLTLVLNDNGAKLEYRLKETKQKKFLGLIPITTSVTTTVSAETGEVNSQFAPWFSKFLF